MSRFYEFAADSLQNQPVSMKEYEGKVVLVVNTASQCGLTPQYEGLEKLYEQYGDKGLVILGFPCNQFGGQEPGGAKEISGGCLINYGVTFPMFGKVEVNGDKAHPIFKYLKEALPGVLGGGIKWNFTKFLIGRDGIPVKRFAPSTPPAKIEKYIQAQLETGGDKKIP